MRSLRIPLTSVGGVSRVPDTGIVIPSQEIVPASFEDSFVGIYHGPRRGGKTASLSTDAAMHMLNGQTVFSNYPIAFDYQEDEKSPVYHYASLPLNYDEIVSIGDNEDYARKYAGSFIAWDESAISLNNRQWQTPRNRLMALMITLIGKLEISFGFTCQFLSRLDGAVKEQADAIVFCCDMSFKFKNLERGTTISQSFQDISGRWTGEMYEMSEKVYRLTFHAKPFWGIYSTKQMFSILQPKQTMDDFRAKALLKAGEAEGGTQASGTIAVDSEQNIILLAHVIFGLDAKRKEAKIKTPLVLDQAILYKEAKDNGFVGKPSDMGFMLNRMGGVIDSARRWHLSKIIESLSQEEETEEHENTGN